MTSLASFFVIAAYRESPDGGDIVPDIVSRYPVDDTRDNALPGNVAIFCLPDDNDLVERRPPRHHSFVLTELSGAHLYASCILFQETQDETFCPKSICLLSRYPLFSVLRDYLWELYCMHARRVASARRREPLAVCDRVPLERYVLNLIRQVPVPPPGKLEVRFTVGSATLSASRAAVNDFPDLDVPLQALFTCFDVSGVILLFRALLLEQKIVIVSRRVQLLTPITEALLALMFPFRWEHIYIPLLPQPLCNFLNAPVPFLVGMLSSYDVPDGVPSEVIRADVDTGTVAVTEAVARSFPALPEYVQRKLVKRLRECTTKRFDIDTFCSSLTSSPQRAVSPPPASALASPTGSPSALSPPTAGPRRRSVSPRTTVPDDDDGDDDDEGDDDDGRAIRHAFLRFFISIFAKYQPFLILTGGPGGAGDEPDLECFDKKGFLQAVDQDCRAFVSAFMGTQAFMLFTEDRVSAKSKKGVDFAALFFDESIAAKKNLSRMKLKRRKTLFLQDPSFKTQRAFVAPVADTSAPLLPEDYEPSLFPSLDPQYFVPDPGPPEDLASSVTAQTEEYTQRMMSNPTLYTRVVEALLAPPKSRSTVDWGVFGKYLPSLPEYASLQNDRTQPHIDELFWIQEKRTETQRQYYWNARTLECTYDSPEFYVSRQEHQAFLKEMDDLACRKHLELQMLRDKQVQETRAMRGQFERVLDSMHERHTTEAHAFELSAQEGRVARLRAIEAERRSLLTRRREAVSPDSPDQRMAELMQRRNERLRLAKEERMQARAQQLSDLNRFSGSFEGIVGSGGRVRGSSLIVRGSKRDSAAGTLNLGLVGPRRRTSSFGGPAVPGPPPRADPTAPTLAAPGAIGRSSSSSLNSPLTTPDSSPTMSPPIGPVRSLSGPAIAPAGVLPTDPPRPQPTPGPPSRNRTASGQTQLHSPQSPPPPHQKQSPQLASPLPTVVVTPDSIAKSFPEVPSPPEDAPPAEDPGKQRVVLNEGGVPQMLPGSATLPRPPPRPPRIPPSGGPPVPDEPAGDPDAARQRMSLTDAGTPRVFPAHNTLPRQPPRPTKAPRPPSETVEAAVVAGAVPGSAGSSAGSNTGSNASPSASRTTSPTPDAVPGTESTAFTGEPSSVVTPEGGATLLPLPAPARPPRIMHPPTSPRSQESPRSSEDTPTAGFTRAKPRPLPAPPHGHARSRSTGGESVFSLSSDTSMSLSMSGSDLAAVERARQANAARDRERATSTERTPMRGGSARSSGAWEGGDGSAGEDFDFSRGSSTGMPTLNSSMPALATSVPELAPLAMPSPLRDRMFVPLYGFALPTPPSPLPAVLQAGLPTAPPPGQGADSPRVQQPQPVIGERSGDESVTPTVLAKKLAPRVLTEQFAPPKVHFAEELAPPAVLADAEGSPAGLGWEVSSAAEVVEPPAAELVPPVMMADGGKEESAAAERIGLDIPVAAPVVAPHAADASLAEPSRTPEPPIPMSDEVTSASGPEDAAPPAVPFPDTIALEGGAASDATGSDGSDERRALSAPSQTPPSCEFMPDPSDPPSEAVALSFAELNTERPRAVTRQGSAGSGSTHTATDSGSGGAWDHSAPSTPATVDETVPAPFESIVFPATPAALEGSAGTALGPPFPATGAHPEIAVSSPPSSSSLDRVASLGTVSGQTLRAYLKADGGGDDSTSSSSYVVSNFSGSVAAGGDFPASDGSNEIVPEGEDDGAPSRGSSSEEAFRRRAGAAPLVDESESTSSTDRLRLQPVLLDPSGPGDIYPLSADPIAAVPLDDANVAAVVGIIASAATAQAELPTVPPVAAVAVPTRPAAPTGPTLDDAEIGARYGRRFQVSSSSSDLDD